jgi:hypothetical protein
MAFYGSASSSARSVYVGCRRFDQQQQQQTNFGPVEASLGVPGAFTFHPSLGGWRGDVAAKIAGIYGVLAIHEGRCFTRELKAQGGHLSGVQKATQTALADAEYIVATAAPDQLECWGMLGGRLQ